MKKLMFFLLLCCLTSSLFAATDSTRWYADYLLGNDANSGYTMAAAKKNFYSLIDSTDPGDTICLAKSNDPDSLGQATWTDSSAYVILASAQTATIDDCEDAWTAVSPNTQADNTQWYYEGSYCRALTVADGFSTGKAFYETISSTDFSAYDTISFWLRSSVDVDADVIQIKLCSDTDGDVEVDSITVDTRLEANRPLPISMYAGGALGSAIQSVALYILIDQGSLIIYIDNIEACNALSHRTLISKRGLTGPTSEGLYPIKSISGTVVRLGNVWDFGVTATAHVRYGGATETVTTWAWPTIATTVPTTDLDDVFPFADAGDVDDKLYIIGGYNSTGAKDVGSMTIFDGLCNYGEGIVAIGGDYSHQWWKDIGVTRYHVGMRNDQHDSQNHSTFYNIHIVGCGSVVSDYNFYHTDSWGCEFINFFSIGSEGDGIRLEDENNSRWDSVYVIGNEDEGIHIDQGDGHIFTHAKILCNFDYAVRADGGANFQQCVDLEFRDLVTRYNEGSNDRCFYVCNSYIKCEDVSISEVNVDNWDNTDEEVQSRTQRIQINKWDNTFGKRITYTKYGTISDQITGGLDAAWAYGGSGTCDLLKPTNAAIALNYPVAIPVAKNEATTVSFYVRKTSSGATPTLKASAWGSGVAEVRDTSVTLTTSWALFSFPEMTPTDSGWIFIDFRAYSDTGGIGIDQYGGGLLADFKTADWTRWAYVTGGVAGYFNTADWTMWAYADGGVTDLSAITVPKVDTFWVVDDGFKLQWDSSVLFADRHKMIWNHEACNSDSFLKEDTEGQEYSFEIASTCPADFDKYLPFIDSVRYHWCGKGEDGASGQNLVKLGFWDQSTGYKSDSVTYLLGVGQLQIEHPVPDDDGNAWNTYRFYDDEWIMRSVEIEDEPPFGLDMECHTAFIISYQSYPETLTDGGDALVLYEADTTIVSQWDKTGCTDIEECLTTIQCDDVRTNVANELEIFGHEEVTLATGILIDSVVTLVCGYHQTGGDSAVGIFYSVVSGGDSTLYDLDTFYVPEIVKNGAQYTKVWPTCPSTDLAWTAADINTSGQGFGFKSLHTNYIALTTYRLLLYLSGAAEEEEEGFPARFVLYNGEIKRVCDNAITQIIY